MQIVKNVGNPRKFHAIKKPLTKFSFSGLLTHQPNKTTRKLLMSYLRMTYYAKLYFYTKDKSDICVTYLLLDCFLHPSAYADLLVLRDCDLR